MKTHQYRGAMQHVRTMVKLRPELPEPYFLLARVYAGLDLTNESIQMLDESLKRSPDYVPAQAMLGIMYDRAGKSVKAQEWHRKAIALAPNQVSYRNNLGFSLYLQGNYKEALAEYHEALKKDSGSRRLLNNIGFTYGKLGDNDVAFKHFKAAGGFAAASNNMGLVHENRGELEIAFKQFSLALESEPELERARGNMARVCEKLGRPVPKTYVIREEQE
jgi:Flp pilus assembly protein TadD